jgi:hypothetical protein
MADRRLGEVALADGLSLFRRTLVRVDAATR